MIIFMKGMPWVIRVLNKKSCACLGSQKRTEAASSEVGQCRVGRMGERHEPANSELLGSVKGAVSVSVE